MNGRQRREVARLARQVMAGKLSHAQFCAATYECEQDDDIDELENLMTHMPGCGGIFGTSEEQHKQYLSLIEAAIQKLEK